MPVTCIVVGCTSRGHRDKVKFFKVPAILNHRFLTDKNDLSVRRRNSWLAVIKREDLTETKLKNQRVCSKHFITGKPAALEDENHPDWVPSQHMGHESQKIRKRKDGLEKRKKFKAEEVDCLVEIPSGSQDNENEPETGIACQTDITMEELSLKFNQLEFASQKIEILEKSIDKATFGLGDDTRNDTKWKYYTGFTYSFVESFLYKTIESDITTTSVSVLSGFNQLLLTLIKLRLNLDFQLLAYEFKISPITVAACFENIIDILYKKFRHFIIWPNRSVAKKNVPLCFQEAFQDKVTIILHCFEVFIEKPHSLKTQKQTWSNYKHRNTIKYLIGITPQGTVSYISKAWGGRISDKEIVENSDFLNKILPGDIVLADRDFLIKETSAFVRSKLVIPAFTQDKNQLQHLDIEAARQAHVRIHVERIIGMIKNKFNIFKDTIPISMLRKGNDPDNLNILDKIVTVCCVFINLSPPIVPLE